MIKRLWIIIFTFVCLSLSSCGRQNEQMWISGDTSDAIEENFDSVDVSTVEMEKIWVYVSGEVIKPGVYEFENKARVFEAIDAAGGFTKDADTTCINLASSMEDGEQIIVYSVLASQEVQKQDGIININTASAAQLQTIPGIGESRALAIVAYREQNGPFKQKEDIMQISGIKAGLYEKIKDKIKVK